MTNSTQFKVPQGFSAAARKWLKLVVETHPELNEHKFKCCLLAAQAWDQSQAAHAALKKHGITFENRFGELRPRPEVQIAKDATATFVRTVKYVGLLDVGPPTDDDEKEEYFGT